MKTTGGINQFQEETESTFEHNGKSVLQKQPTSRRSRKKLMNQCG
jgi:hypothetical protein